MVWTPTPLPGPCEPGPHEPCCHVVFTFHQFQSSPTCIPATLSWAWFCRTTYPLLALVSLILLCPELQYSFSQLLFCLAPSHPLGFRLHSAFSKKLSLDHSKVCSLWLWDTLMYSHFLKHRASVCCCPEENEDAPPLLGVFGLIWNADVIFLSIRVGLQ